MRAPLRADEHAVAGRVAQRVDRRLLPREVGRLGHQLVGLDDGEVGEAAEVRLEAPDALVGGQHRVVVGRRVLVVDVVAVDGDPVARLPVAHRRPDPQHDAGGVGADHVVGRAWRAPHSLSLPRRSRKPNVGSGSKMRRPHRVEVDASWPSPRRRPRRAPARAWAPRRRAGSSRVLVGRGQPLEHADVLPADEGGPVGLGDREGGQLVGPPRRPGWPRGSAAWARGYRPVACRSQRGRGPALERRSRHAGERMISPRWPSLLALITAASYGVGDFVGRAAPLRRRRAAQRRRRLRTCRDSSASRCSRPWSGPTWSARPTCVLGAAGGACGCLGVVLLYRGLATGQMAVVSPISAVGRRRRCRWSVASSRASAQARWRSSASRRRWWPIALVSRSGPMGRPDPRVAARRGRAPASASACSSLLISGDPRGGRAVAARHRPAHVRRDRDARSRSCEGCRRSFPGSRCRWPSPPGALDVTANVTFLLATQRGLVSVVAVIAVAVPGRHGAAGHGGRRVSGSRRRRAPASAWPPAALVVSSRLIASCDCTVPGRREYRPARRNADPRRLAMPGSYIVAGARTPIGKLSRRARLASAPPSSAASPSRPRSSGPASRPTRSTTCSWARC